LRDAAHREETQGMRIVTILALALTIGGCARFGAAMGGFSKGVASADGGRKQTVCRPSPYVAGETVCTER
jgi:hypothetical protein